MSVRELMPFLIPLIIAEIALLGFTIWHILTVGMEFIGPALYFLLGKEDN